MGRRDFLEVRDVIEVELRPGGEPVVTRRRDAGHAREQLGTVGQVLDHDAVPLGIAGASLDDRTLAAAWDALASAPDLHEVAAARALGAIGSAAAACGATLDASLRHQRQRVHVRTGDQDASDERASARLELRINTVRGKPAQAVQRELSWGSIDELVSDLPVIEALLARSVEDASHRRELVPAPLGALPVVIPPGADAGVFFHEVCGHPLEADVVVRQASYLARLRGRKIADAQVTIADGPPADVGFRAAIDDEGAPARTARLIHAGVVSDPLSDGEHGTTLGVPGGHARRVGWRHPSVPRMSHTHVLPATGSRGGSDGSAGRGAEGPLIDALLAPVRRGLYVSHLTPRHMNLLGGDFSFYVVEARLIEDGVLGAWVEPCVLEGHGVEALAALEAVGADARGFYGLKGCGKLDHGPLDVSFGCPSLRFAQLGVRPWKPPT